MTFQFSKELTDIDLNSSAKPQKQLRLYKVYNDRGMMFGNFFYYPNEQTFTFSDTEIFIKTISKLFKAPQFLLVDRKDGKQIGHF